MPIYSRVVIKQYIEQLNRQKQIEHNLVFKDIRNKNNIFSHTTTIVKEPIKLSYYEKYIMPFIE